MSPFSWLPVKKLKNIWLEKRIFDLKTIIETAWRWHQRRQKSGGRSAGC
jgi:hypothetical protein